DDQVFPIRSCGNDFDLWGRLQSPQNARRVIASDNHHLWRCFFRFIDYVAHQCAETHAQKWKQEERDNDTGDHGTAIAKCLPEFLAIDDTNIAERHLLGLRFDIQGRNDFDEDLFEVFFAMFFAKLRERSFGEQLAGLNDANHITESFDLGHDVSGEDDGFSAVTAFADKIDNAARRHYVKAGRRFVENHNGGIMDEGACD